MEALEWARPLARALWVALGRLGGWNNPNRYRVPFVTLIHD